MRRIGELDAGRAAAFSDVLAGHGIDADVRDDEVGAAIWVHDDAQVDEARDLLDAFLAEPNAAAFTEAAERGRARRKAVQRKDVAYQKRVALAQRSLHGAGGRGNVTLGLLIVSVIVAAVGGLGSRFDLLEPLFLTTFPPRAGLPEVMSGQVWRLFTPIVVHFGILHLAFNGYMWWTWAQGVEVRKGPVFFGLLVLSSAATSNLGEFAWQRFLDTPYPVLVGGLSGVLYAVFGYAWAKGRIDPTDGLGLDDRTTIILVGWLLICMTGFMGTIANAAHVVGAVHGVLWAYGDVAWFRWNKARLR